MGKDARLNPFSTERKVDPVVLDCWGRALQEGDEVTLQPTVGYPFFRILKIQPVMDPNLPPNLMAVDLVCRWRFHVGRGTPTPAMVLTRTREEMVPVAAATEEAAEEGVSGPKLVEN